MEPENINGCGVLYVYNDVSTKAQIATDMLHDTIMNFAQTSIFFHSIEKYHPSFYSEKSLASLLLPSMAGDNRTYAVTAEYPIKRKRSKFSWVDYWVFCRRGLFLVETKHTWVNSGTGNFRKTAQDKWKKAIDQTDSVPRNEIWNDLKEHGHDVSTMDCYRVPLLIGVFIDSTKNEKMNWRECWPDTTRKEKLVQGHKNMRKGLNPQPNWSALWVLNENLEGPYDREKSGLGWIYPAVGFSAYVHIRSSKA
jgi:hypothetical protein